MICEAVKGMKLTMNSLFLCFLAFHLQLICGIESDDDLDSENSSFDGPNYLEIVEHELWDRLQTAADRLEPIYEMQPLPDYSKTMLDTGHYEIVISGDAQTYYRAFKAKMMYESYEGEVFIVRINVDCPQIPLDDIKTLNAFQNPEIEKYGIANVYRYETSFRHDMPMIMYTDTDLYFPKTCEDERQDPIEMDLSYSTDMNILLALKYFIRATKYIHSLGFLADIEHPLVLFKGNRALFAGFGPLKQIPFGSDYLHPRNNWAHFINLLSMERSSIRISETVARYLLTGHRHIHHEPQLNIHLQWRIKKSFRLYREYVDEHKDKVRKARQGPVGEILLKFINEAAYGQFKNVPLKERLFPDYDKFHQIVVDAIRKLSGDDFIMKTIDIPFDAIFNGTTNSSN